MASYTVHAEDRGAYEKSLLANTVDTVTLYANLGGAVEIKALTGTAPLYVTFDGVAPTVKGDHCYDIQVGTAAQIWDLPLSYPAVVQLISSAAATYSVSGLNSGVFR